MAARRVCPHCGGLNPASAIITLCRSCGGRLSGPASGPPAGSPRPVETRLPEPEPGPAADLPSDEGLAPAGPESAAPPHLPAIHPEGASLALPIWLHLTIYTIASMVGWLAGPWLFMAYHRAFFPPWLPVPVGFIAAAFVGLLIPRLIFQKLIHGRCPRCGGPAALRGGRPITYTCRACGHVHATRVSGG